MAEIFNELSKKKALLVQRKIALKAEFYCQIREIDTEINAINKAVAVIDNAVKDYVCPNCKGDGTVRVCDAAGDMYDETCPKCLGTGVKI